MRKKKSKGVSLTNVVCISDGKFAGVLSVAEFARMVVSANSKFGGWTRTYVSHVGDFQCTSLFIAGFGQKCVDIKHFCI